jgi:phosphate/sulfate permease
MKINNYIKYLLTLILLPGINIYAQASENLSQVASQAQQEVSNLTPPLNLSFLNPITSQFWYYFFNYGLTYLLAFGIITFLGWELLWKKEGEINRPLLLVFAIIAFFITYYLHATLIALAIFAGVILLFIWLYKLIHSVTGSIIGTIIVVLLAYIVLTSGGSITGLLSSVVFYILLFIFFIFIFIYGYKLSQSNKTKKLLYHIYKPQDIKNLENSIKQDVQDFENVVRRQTSQLKKYAFALKSIINNRQISNQDKIKKIKRLLRNIRQTIINFQNNYTTYKTRINNYETIIRKRYNEPTRSILLQILKKEEGEIDIQAHNAHREFMSTYHQEVQPLQQTIIKIAKKNDRKTIRKIYNDIENILGGFSVY